MNCPHPYEQYEYDGELSFRQFINWEFLSRPEYDFNNKVIYNSVFTNEIPDSDIFGEITGATFIKCHLQNVVIPPGNEIIDCDRTRYQCQNDWNDWEINPGNQPIRPTNHKIFTKLGLPMPDPRDIPERRNGRVDLIEKAKNL